MEKSSNRLVGEAYIQLHASYEATIRAVETPRLVTQETLKVEKHAFGFPTLDRAEVAQQLTLIEEKLVQQITVTDFMKEQSERNSSGPVYELHKYSEWVSLSINRIFCITFDSI